MDSGRKYRARWGYLAASIIVFIIELIIALYVHDRIIRPYIGGHAGGGTGVLFCQGVRTSGNEAAAVICVSLCGLCGGDAVFPSGRDTGAAGERRGQDYPGFCL